MALGYVLVSAEPGHEQAVLATIQRLPGVVEAMPILGEFDIIAKVEAEDLEGLGTRIAAGIQPLAGVAATRSLTVARL